MYLSDGKSYFKSAISGEICTVKTQLFSFQFMCPILPLNLDYHFFCPLLLSYIQEFTDAMLRVTIVALPLIWF